MDFPGGVVVRNRPAMQETQETWVPTLGWEDPLDEGMATHSSILVWRNPWTGAHQAPPFSGFSRQDYWNRLPCPHPGDLPNPGMDPGSLLFPALAGGFLTPSTTWDRRQETATLVSQSFFLMS